MDEKLLQLYTSCIHGGHIIKDLDTNEELISDNLIKNIGYKPISLLNLIDKKYIDDVNSIIDKAKLNQHDFYDIRCEMTISVEDHRVISLRIKCIDRKLYIILADITRTESVQLLLTQARFEAENALQSKSRFLAAMSHEIRTPLNGIIGMTELLKTNGLTDDTKQSIETINLCSQLLLTLVNNILDFSKLEEGKLSLNNESFNLKKCCEEILAMLNPKYKNKSNIELLFIYEDNVPQNIIGDKIRITQILTNIIGNAIKFTETGFVKLSVSIKPSMNISNIILVFDVEDTGIGISKEGINHLFKTYNQVDPTIHKKYGGTGLGLVIANSLCQLMNGDIHVSSTLGEGSLFRITLNVKRPLTDSCPDVIALDSPTRQLLPKELKILSVEDNEINQLVLSKMLARLGYTCDKAMNGVQAVSQVKNNSYDIIFMDINMPIMDGIEATKIIRELGYHRIKIVALTADALPEDKQKCLSANMNDYLSKPVNLQALKNVIQTQDLNVTF